MTDGYHTILMDPPWHEQGGGKSKRGADRHYDLVKDRDMLGVVLGCPLLAPAPQCHLWMWVTANRLPLGLSIMAALGFRYLNNVVWVKPSIGLGRYIRGQHELLLFGVRGPTQLPAVPPPSAIHAPRRRHSQKPDEQYTLIEAVSVGPRLEMFARTARDGWDRWGLEAPK